MDSLVLTNRHLALALKARRKELGLTQLDAASRVGLLPKTISAMESSPERASVESLFKYLSALNKVAEIVWALLTAKTEFDSARMTGTYKPMNLPEQALSVAM